MAAKSKFYSKNIAHGIGILVFSILFAAIIRALYFLNFGISEVDAHNSLLWEYFAPLFENPYISFGCNTLIVTILAIFTSHIDTKHLLIRQKTFLPASFIILLFSSHPTFLTMSGEFISVVLMLMMLSALFSSYNIPQKQHAAFSISFSLAISGLFSTAALFYFPFLWLGLTIMRLFNFKALVASLFGIFIAYFPFFSYFLLTDNIDTFSTPFVNMSTLSYSLPILNYEIKEWIILALSTLLLIIAVSDDYINRHKDKIRVRAYFNLLILLCIFALTAFMFINANPLLHLFIAFIAGAFILSHFFALVEGKAATILFYISLILFMAITISPFFSIF